MASLSLFQQLILHQSICEHMVQLHSALFIKPYGQALSLLRAKERMYEGKRGNACVCTVRVSMCWYVYIVHTTRKLPTYVWLVIQTF